jgi:hypothetical protein
MAATLMVTSSAGVAEAAAEEVVLEPVELEELPQPLSGNCDEKCVS